MKTIILTSVLLLAAIILFEEPELKPVRFETTEMHLSINTDVATLKRWNDHFERFYNK